jgi:2-amino-4-hydroxy-6-hydroxymethyldihydropteridine diphosphokinase
MTRAVLSIGSNQGDRLSYLQSAVNAFSPYIVGISPVFRTPPWGPVQQADYLNAVLLVDDPTASANDWLHRSQDCEDAAGRTRGTRWGPRTLDVDVISVDEQINDDPELTLPHPRAAERAFVLVPWTAVDPEAVLAGLGPVSKVLAGLPSDEVEQIELVSEAVLQR